MLSSLVGGAETVVFESRSSLPSQVILQPFRAYDAELAAKTGERASTLFQGRVTVDLNVYLAGVVLGEIDIAKELVDAGLGGQRPIAFNTQAQVALNQVLAKVKVKAGKPVEVAGGIPGQRGTFQTVALPLSSARIGEVVTAPAGAGACMSTSRRPAHRG